MWRELEASLEKPDSADQGYEVILLLFQFAMEPNYLHIWPRNTFMMIALPNMVITHRHAPLGHGNGACGKELAVVADTWRGLGGLMPAWRGAWRYPQPEPGVSPTWGVQGSTPRASSVLQS